MNNCETISIRIVETQDHIFMQGNRTIIIIIQDIFIK